LALPGVRFLTIELPVGGKLLAKAADKRQRALPATVVVNGERPITQDMHLDLIAGLEFQRLGLLKQPAQNVSSLDPPPPLSKLESLLLLSVHEDWSLLEVSQVPLST
jgi:hypothetical protein